MPTPSPSRWSRLASTQTWLSALVPRLVRRGRASRLGKVVRRGRSIRAQVLILLLAPLVPLVGMWLFSTGISLDAASDLFHANTNATMAAYPANTLVTELQQERALSTRFVGSNAKSDDLAKQRERTDRAIADFRQQTSTDRLQTAASPLTKRYLAALTRALDRLPAGRAAIDTHTAQRLDVLDLYDGIISEAFGLYGSISTLDNQSVARQANTVTALTEAREQLTQEDALLGAALAGKDQLTAAEHGRLIAIIGQRRQLYAMATRYLQPADQDAYQHIITGAPFTRLTAAEDRLANPARDPLSGMDATAWKADYTAVNKQLTDLEDNAATRAVAATKPAATTILLQLGIAGGAGLLIIVALIILAARVALSLLRRVNELHDEALDVAERRLPSVVARLRAGEEVDIDAEAPPLTDAGDELGQLAQAFAEVQRTAVTSAVQEANLRAGLNQVFLNLGRRHQLLVHRQLGLLEAMERRISDPHDLEELYRIDHLAARMRRHAEDLVILAGSVPGRGWRNPVPMHAVLRSAVSEVEQFTRITVLPQPELSLAGRAVSDIVHLVAELLENATSFSPRDTQVTVSGQLVPNGFAVEVTDRGVGMPAEEIELANARLAEPPDFDPAHSSRLGLFVVSRLAARHDVKVTLRPSAYGGITAIALIPRDIVVEPGAPEPELPAGHSPRHAASPAELPGPPEPVASTAVERTPAPGPDLAAASQPAASQPAGAGTTGTPTRPAASTEPELSPEGLPLRRRQTHLAPQLQESLAPTATGAATPDTGPGATAGPATTGTPGAASAAGTPPRAPATTRTILSSLQAGTDRGRADAARQRATLAAPPTAADTQETPE